MKNEQQWKSQYELRRIRRENRQRRRHVRHVLLGAAFGVVLLLAGHFIIGRLVPSSSADDPHALAANRLELVEESSETLPASTEEVSIQYETQEQRERQNLAPREHKEQQEGYTDRLDVFLEVTEDTTLYERDSTKSLSIAPLAKGTFVETYGTEGEWTKVVSMGRTGYVRNRDLSVIADAKQFKTVDGQVIVNSVYGLDPSYETVFHPDAAAALKVMLEAMEREGLELEVATTYRSAQEEEKELVLRGNPEHAPEPGHAVFQTGYGVQFNAPNTDPRMENHFENTEQFAWLKAHACEYGFVLRYPEGSESITGYRADPTIFYFVGVEDASIISNEGLTMEVFYGVN